MLVSHRKKFIFTKTEKTAGTSVESYFEQFCMAEGTWSEAHFRDSHVSEAGIIGNRALKVKDETWYNHMPAARIRELIGEEVWNSYFKFTVVRNPFDKLVSGFYWYPQLIQDRKKSLSLGRKLRSSLKKMVGVEKASPRPPIERAEGSNEMERFRSWIKKGGSIIDRDKYLIDGKECVDYFIQFEKLNEGIAEVCQRLSLPYEPDRLPEFKKGIRKGKVSLRDYYDDETEAIVRDLYRWEIEKFGYEIPK